MKHTLMELHLLKEEKVTLDMAHKIIDKYKSKVPSGIKVEFTNYESDTEKGDYQVDYNLIRIKRTHKNLQDFIETVLHEIHHAMDAKRYDGQWGKGPKGYKLSYEIEMGYQEGKGKDGYDHNKYEIAAEKWCKQEYRRNWKNFKF